MLSPEVDSIAEEAHTGVMTTTAATVTPIRQCECGCEHHDQDRRCTLCAGHHPHVTVTDDILGWAQALPARDLTVRPVAPDTTPVPAATPGWTILSFGPDARPDQWKVVARSGARVLHLDRLDAAAVTALDLNARWAQ